MLVAVLSEPRPLSRLLSLLPPEAHVGQIGTSAARRSEHLPNRCALALGRHDTQCDGRSRPAASRRGDLWYALHGLAPKTVAPISPSLPFAAAAPLV
jgi:hypothetical protein